METNKRRLRLTEPECNLLLTNANEYSFKDGQVIGRDGDIATAFRVKSGVVRVEKDGCKLCELQPVCSFSSSFPSLLFVHSFSLVFAFSFFVLVLSFFSYLIWQGWFFRESILIQDNLEVNDVDIIAVGPVVVAKLDVPFVQKIFAAEPVSFLIIRLSFISLSYHFIIGDY